MIQTKWKSPSNIALVKYWGKHGRQLPRNASISFTLHHCHTITEISIEEKKADGQISVDFFFENKKQDQFKSKIVTFLNSILSEMPFLGQFHFNIHSSNSFPHSAGIASSASSMSALMACICDLEKELGFQKEGADFLKRVSYFSRLASGSACRSVYPLAASWGQSNYLSLSSDEYASPFDADLHIDFHDFHDDVLIVSRNEKSVSSTVGHNLMHNNPFADIRYKQADLNMKLMLQALKSGDIEEFGRITEAEALMLHALMMTSSPSFVLMEPSSLEIIKKVQSFRKETSIPLYFTLDAGPNVHLLYPHNVEEEVNQFISAELSQHCDQNQVIRDFVGKGLEKL